MGLSKLSYPFHDRTITVTQYICINEGSSSLAKTLIAEIKRIPVSMLCGVSSVAKPLVR